MKVQGLRCDFTDSFQNSNLKINFRVTGNTEILEILITQYSQDSASHSLPISDFILIIQSIQTGALKSHITIFFTLFAKFEKCHI